MDEVLQRIAGEITLSKNPGASMKKWREIFGISQVDLASHMNITSSTISDYEGNRRKSPGINVIKRFVQSIIEMDKARGSEVLKRMSVEKKANIFEVHDFSHSIPAQDIINKVKGRIITNKGKISDLAINGYSVVDSFRAILELQVDEFPKIYGATTNRAVIFTKVGLGRSPMVAVRVTKLKPSLIIFHGVDEVDALGKKISEVEKIPIVITNLPLNEIEEALQGFE